MTARLPRPWRRRPTSAPNPVRPEGMAGTAPTAVLDEPAVPYGRRCALANPAGRPGHRMVAAYQDAHPGVVDRGMVQVPAGQHRAPGRTVIVELVGDDDFPTAPIRLDATPTVAFPRPLLLAFAPQVPAAVAR